MASRAQNVFEFRRVNMHGTKSGPHADPDYAERYHPGRKNLPLEDRLEGFKREYYETTVGSPLSGWRMHPKYPVKIMLSVNKDKGRIDVHGLESLEPLAPEPYATRVLQEGLDLADKWNVELWQIAVAYDPIEGDEYVVGEEYLGWQDLQRWYESQGFIQYGGYHVYYPGSRGSERNWL